MGQGTVGRAELRIHRAVYRPPYTTRGPARPAAIGPADRLQAGWGVQEVLAHLVFWHEHYVRLLSAELTGGEPPLLTGTFVELNAGAVRQFAAEAIDALARRLTDAQAALERLAADPRTAEIDVRIEARGKPWPWPAFVRRVEGHIRGHEADLSRRLRRSARGR